MLNNSQNLPPVSEFQFLLIQLAATSSDVSKQALETIVSGLGETDNQGVNKGAIALKDHIDSLQHIVNSLTELGYLPQSELSPCPLVEAVSHTAAHTEQDSLLMPVLHEQWAGSVTSALREARKKGLVVGTQTYSKKRRDSVMKWAEAYSLFTLFDCTAINLDLLQEYFIDHPSTIDDLVWLNEFLNRFHFVPTSNRHLVIARDHETESHLELSVNIDLPFSNDYSDIHDQPFYVVMQALLEGERFPSFLLTNSSPDEIARHHAQFMENESVRNRNRT